MKIGLMCTVLGTIFVFFVFAGCSDNGDSEDNSDDTETGLIDSNSSTEELTDSNSNADSDTIANTDAEGDTDTFTIDDFETFYGPCIDNRDCVDNSTCAVSITGDGTFRVCYPKVEAEDACPLNRIVSIVPDVSGWEYSCEVACDSDMKCPVDGMECISSIDDRCTWPAESAE